MWHVLCTTLMVCKTSQYANILQAFAHSAWVTVVWKQTAFDTMILWRNFLSSNKQLSVRILTKPVCAITHSSHIHLHLHLHNTAVNLPAYFSP